MAGTTIRRPLPALISLLALLLLTGIVWWRVANRDDHGGASAACPTPTPTASQQTAALPAPGAVTLQVVNATTRTGLAGTVRTTMIQLGFKVPAKAANDPLKKRIDATAQIRYGPAGRQAATLLRYYFPGAAVVATTSRDATVVVALGDRYRRVATQAEVDAALKAAKVSVSSAPPATASAAAPASSTSAGC